MKKTLKNLTIPFITLFLLSNPVLANDDEQVFSIKTEQKSNKNAVVFDDEQEDGKVIFNDSQKTSKKENKPSSKQTTNESDNDEEENSEPQGDYISDEAIMSNMEAASAAKYSLNDKINLNAKAQLIEYDVVSNNQDIKKPDLTTKNNQQVNFNIYKNWLLYVVCLSVIIFIFSVIKFFNDKKKLEKHVKPEEKE